MNTLSAKLLTLMTASSLTLLSACGGGGGSEASVGNKQMVSKSFTVSLTSVDVTRTSNGDKVAVDTSGISSGMLTLNSVRSKFSSD